MVKSVKEQFSASKLVSETLSNGNKINYRVVDGTYYHAETPYEVVSWLETSRQRKQRIRIFLGDTKTGRDWMEEYDVVGHVGRSTGEIKVPLLIKSEFRSNGGGAILDHCIVRIVTKGSNGKPQEVYRHPKYKVPELEVIETPESDKLYCEGYKAMVFNSKNENVANFKTVGQAQRWVAFMKGERMGK